MNDEKNINYSAADIARYYNRQMSAMEMHALEKAALDDPFLADALEGYKTVSVTAEADIAILNRKLDEKIKSNNKVIQLSPPYRWLRIAAIFILVAGTGALAYQFIIKNNRQDVAVLEKKEENKKAVPQKDTAKENEDVEVKAPDKTTEIQARPSTGSSGQAVNSAPELKDNVTRAEETTTRVDAIPGEAAETDVNKKQKDEKVLQEPVITPARQDITKPAITSNSKNKALRKEAAEDQLAEGKKENNYSINYKANVFQGQVLDANNTPLPFANVTNTKDNVGTYTDVKGYFTLVSPDSLLNVQVRSVGFENTHTQLQNNGPSQPIVLQQDTRNIPSTVIGRGKVNTERKMRSTLVVEEPEPSDGWYNYDTYLANNVKIPDNLKEKNTAAEVELSFDVNKYGEPVNIKVEKSSCRECDSEAIRLLKEGPKWKKKKKSRRAHVNIPF